jgi:hypothetical protein
VPSALNRIIQEDLTARLCKIKLTGAITNPNHRTKRHWHDHFSTCVWILHREEIKINIQGLSPVMILGVGLLSYAIRLKTSFSVEKEAHI